MAEADIVQGRGGLKARDMAAELGGVLVGAHHHRERVPADNRADAPFDLAIAGVVRLAIGGNRVEVRRIGVVGQIGAAQARRGDELFEQKMSAVDAFGINHRLQRIEPFAGFLRVYVLNRFHQTSLLFRDALKLRPAARRRSVNRVTFCANRDESASEAHVFSGGLPCAACPARTPLLVRASARPSRGVQSC